MSVLWVALVLALLEPAAAGDDLDARLELGWRLFDAGRNAEAEAHFVELLDRSAAGCAAAHGLGEARRRACRPTSEPRPETRREPPRALASASGLDAFLQGQAAREAGDLSEAAAHFRQAAERAAGDPRACAAALLEAIDCLLQDGRFAPVDSLIAPLWTQAAALAPSARARLGLEVRVRAAGAANLAGRLDAADSLYAAAAAEAIAAGHAAEACDALNGRGTVASRRRLVDDSRRHYGAALALARRLDDVTRQAKILLNLAYDQTQARQFDAADGTLAAAAQLVTGCGLERMSGHLLTGQGAWAEARGDRARAVRCFRDASRAFAAAKDRGGELGARQRLGYDLAMSGHYGEAVTEYERALALTDTLASPQVRNWVLAGLALTHHRLGHLDRAEQYYHQAMAVNEALGDRMSVALCQNSLGLLEVLRGNYREAMLHDLAALELYTQLGDRQGMGDARVALADLHFRLGDWDRALAEFEAAAAIARAHGLEELLQGAVTGLTAVCTAAGQPARARAHCEEGLRIARRWQDNNAIIWTLVELAEQSIADGDRAAARTQLAEAESRLWPRGPHVLRSRTRLAQARCADDPHAAIALAEAALTHAEVGGLPEQEWVCLTELGALHVAAGDTAAAIAACDRAITVIESLRRNVGSDELRRHMLRPALAPYERIIGLLVARGAPGDVRLAFAYTERAKARVLADRLRAAAASGGDTPLDEPQREVLASIAHCQGLLQRADLPDTARATLRQRAAGLEARFLTLALRATGGPAALHAYTLTPPDPTELLAVPRPGEHVVAYFLGHDKSWSFHLTEGRIAAHVLPPREQIEVLVRRFLALHEASDATADQRAAAARRLYALLLEPSLRDVHDPQSLIIAPDGLLHRLPFAALADGSSTLATRCPSFTVPSLQTLDVLRRREAGRQARRGDPKVPAVVIGYGGPRATARLHPWQGRPFAALPEADSEARQVGALFKGSVVLTGEHASERALRAAPLGDAEVLHLAAHGDADDREVMRSFVLLGRGDDGGDGLLQWNEAATLALGTSLVTLASCRSARGPLAVGEGVTGLTQAFLFGGATCVLAAQSDVGDAYSRGFMLEFYRHLRDGEPAARALRRAQLAAAAADTTGRQAWAEFVLVGDGSVEARAAEPPASAPARLLALAGLAGLAIGVAVAMGWHRGSS